MDDLTEMTYDTAILHRGIDRDPGTGALSIPIYNASTYHQKDPLAGQKYEYGRSGNPTREALETTLAALENGVRGFAFPSGMSAVTSAIIACSKSGDHIVAARDIYGGTYRLLTDVLSRFGVNCTFVDATETTAIEAAIHPSTTILFIETPSNPLLKITDISACVSIARKHNLITMIDNTFMSPYFLRPIELGVDMSIHSATKFLGGHSDLIAGAVICRTPELSSKVHFIQNATGAVLSPENSWLLMRGIKTLGARMNAQQAGAVKVSQWLKAQPWVEKVFYPGFPDHPGHAIMKNQATGFGAVISFSTDTVGRAIEIMKKVKLWTVAVSLGGVESILSYPSKMSHAAVPEQTRISLGITDNLIRLSVGLEAPEDLIEDLRNSSELF